MKYVLKFDKRKCVACGACAVACMDQNDTNIAAGDKPFRRVAVIERHDEPEKRIEYLSTGCMHCTGAPCIAACPMGCISKTATRLTVYDNSACIGCRSCEKACPFGAPTFRADGKMEKCDGCRVRLENGLAPACVRICPTGALSCDAVEE